MALQLTSFFLRKLLRWERVKGQAESSFIVLSLPQSCKGHRIHPSGRGPPEAVRAAPERRRRRRCPPLGSVVVQENEREKGKLIRRANKQGWRGDIIRINGSKPTHLVGRGVSQEADKTTASVTRPRTPGYVSMCPSRRHCDRRRLSSYTVVELTLTSIWMHTLSIIISMKLREYGLN